MITKIDRELAEQIVNTIKDVCDHDINFIAPSGIILASTDSSRVGTFHEIGQQVAASGSVLEVTEDNNFSGTKQGINLPLYHNEHLLAVIGKHRSVHDLLQDVRRYQAHPHESYTQQV